MTVSVCIIAYNEEKTLTSLFSDRTRVLMEKFAEEENGFLRVKVFDNPKKKQAAGWNIAIKNSSEDIIIRIDAHTMIPREFVSKNVQCIESGEDVSGGPRPNIAEDDSPWKHTLLLAEKSMFGSSIATYRRSHHKTYVKSVFHGAYRREVFEKAGLFNENLGRTEDNEMHYRILKAGYKICYNPKIISYQHTRNTWRGMIKQKYGNGYWIGLTVGICPRCFSIYHFVPLSFVIALMFSLIMVALGKMSPFIVLILLYGMVNISMSVLAVLKEKKKYVYYLLLPFIFISLHISYGVGTVVGLIRMPRWSKKINREV